MSWSAALHPREGAPPRRALRLVACVAIAGVALVVAYLIAASQSHHRDFAQSWYAARVVLRGGDPYRAIGPGLEFDWVFPFYYPLPAALVAIPFAPFSETAAVALFSAVGAGVLAWALTEHGWWPLLAFLSLGVWDAITASQWSPLFAGAMCLAPLSAILIAKPTIGVAAFLARPNRWGVLGGLALLALSFVVLPHWPAAWQEALSGSREASGQKFPSIVPISLPGGFLMLAALARWRRPEARLVLALACVPLTMAPYESTLFFLVPRGFLQSLALTVSNDLMGWWLLTHPLPANLAERMAVTGRAMSIGVYLPATIMVLLRPNEGPLPRWLERRIESWPPWIRGRPLP